MARERLQVQGLPVRAGRVDETPGVPGRHDARLGGRFGPGLPALYEDWTAFTGWAEMFSAADGDVSVNRSLLVMVKLMEKKAGGS